MEHHACRSVQSALLPTAKESQQVVPGETMRAGE
jgi:hypothetical protein